jgi:S1-C subfamily serine protease
MPVSADKVVIKDRIILVLICMTVIVLGAIIIYQCVIDNNNNIKANAGQKQQSLQVQSKKPTIQNYRHIVNTKLTTLQTPTTTTTENVVSLTQRSSSSLSPLTRIFKQVENSVVQITSKVSNNNPDIIINGNPSESQSTRLGSGFVYDNEGHIVTNSHVVDEAKTVDVTFVDGNTYTANVIGTDPSSDISVLQIKDSSFLSSSGENSTAVPLVIGNSSNLQVGQQIIAIGNPFGLSDTMTTGIISQVGRLLPNPDTGFSIPDGIQTDAAINPGNSGGPLLNMQGQVIGINTAISSSTGLFSGIGFAVPSNTITRIVPVLIQKGSYAHPWLGISGGSITPDLAQRAGLPKNFKGVVVGSVQSESPADKAGLQGVSQDIMNLNAHIGDIITAIDSHPVKRIDDIINHIEAHKSVGDSVKVTVNRNGKTLDLNVILQTRPSSAAR